MALARCGERTPASLLHRTPATPALGNQEMQAATPAAVVRGQLIERFHDEALAATWLTRKKLAPARVVFRALLPTNIRHRRAACTP